MSSSRYHRPKEPLSGLTLQSRDRAVLDAVFDHRYLSTAHLHDLCFHQLSRRVAQIRLRKLWEHGFLDRRFLPVVFGAGPPDPRSQEPLYCLSTRGAAVVAEVRGIEFAEVPHTPLQNAEGFATLDHHLIVTDFVVALAVACRDHPNFQPVAHDREHALRVRLARWREAGRPNIAVVPDGAVTLQLAGRRQTFYIEVFRAGLRGGNQELFPRLLRYGRALRVGFFREAYGHEHVRAVLILTTSDERAATLRAVARRLTHGNRLFWFGAIEKTGTVASTITASTILAKTWTDGAGQPQSFILAGRAPQAPHR